MSSSSKTTLYLLIGIVVLVVLFWVMSYVTGLLFWGALAVVIGAVVLALVRGWWNERQERKHPGRLDRRRAEASVDRVLKELEAQTKQLEEEAENLRRRAKGS